MQKLMELIINVVNSTGVYGPLLACFLIVIESIIPVLPLAVFITFNFIYFGNLLGFILSWIFAVIGCLLSFYLFRKGISGWFNKLIQNKDRLNNLMNKFNNISLTGLTVLIALPFTPAFLINIAAGLSNMEFKKYLLGLLIGKLGLVYFWGYIGTSLLESLENPIILVKIVIILIIEYLISLIVKKLLKI